MAHLSQYQRNGFSLVELMVAISVVTIIAAIAIPSMKTLMAKNRVETHLIQVQSMLQLSRLSAVRNNAFVTLCPLAENQCGTDWQTGMTVFVDFNNNQAFDGDDYVVKEALPLETQDSLTYPRMAVTYRRDGSLSKFQSGSFVYCPKDLPELGRRLTVSQAGRVRMRDATTCS